MILKAENPVYNTIIVFIVVILIIFIIKPDFTYDNEKKRFKKFGFAKNKTLFPIYIIAFIMAILLYIFFYNISVRSSKCPVVDKYTDKYIDKYTDKDMYIDKTLQEYMDFVKFKKLVSS